VYCPGAARPFSTISLLSPPVLLGLALGQEALPQQLALHELELLHKARVGRCRRVATPNKLNRILEGPALLFHQEWQTSATDREIPLAQCTKTTHRGWELRAVSMKVQVCSSASVRSDEALSAKPQLQ